MATFNYAGLAKRADRIMRRFGYDAVDALSFIERDGVRREVTLLESRFTPQERRHPLFEDKDVAFILSNVGETVPPSKEDGDSVILVAADASEQKLMLVREPERVSPGGVNVFWQLHCRPL